VEGHGREEISERVDVSRTVGWFTAVHPVRLEVGGLGPGEAVRAVKEEMRWAPRRGLGYGLLRHLREEEDLAESAPAEVSFNYLGQMDRGLGEGGEFAPAGEGRGPERSPRGRRSQLLDVSGIVLGGRLRLEWSYSRAAHRRETIEAVAGWFADALCALIEQRGTADADDYSPSDFPEADLTSKELEAVIDEVGGGYEP
jgi:non-ribosomal peptide synthase protein (TIGR01720 family)